MSTGGPVVFLGQDVRRELKLVILVFLLVVGPAVVLSFLAGRVLGNWQVIFQRRMETDASDVLDRVAARWAAQFAGIRQDLVKGLASQPPATVAATCAVSNTWFAGFFVYRQGVGLIYPSREETALAFSPRSETGIQHPVLLSRSVTSEMTATNPASAIREFRQMLDQPGVSPDLACRLRLQLAHANWMLGETADALTNLSLVAQYLPALPGTRLLHKPDAIGENSGGSTNPPCLRDPEEGFFYDLIALKTMAQVYRQAGDERGARGADLELMRRGMERYDQMVPLQRAQILDYLGGVTGLVDSTEAPLPAMTALALWRERERSRALDRGFRSRLEQDLSAAAASASGLASGWMRISVGTNDLLVTAAPLPAEPSGEVLIAVQIAQEALRETLSQSASEAGAHLGLAIRCSFSDAMGRVDERKPSTGSSKASGPVLAERRLSPPLERVTLSAYPADLQAFLANVRLQARLYGWGGLVLIFSVVIGGWLMWREAAGEIRAARERSAFAASVSHDLRTPLSSMRMLAESLHLGRINDENKKRQFLGTILKESDRLSRLTDRALFFIQFGQGALRYHLTEGDLGGLVKDVVETFATGIGAEVREDVRTFSDVDGAGPAADGGLPGTQTAIDGAANDRWSIRLAISPDLPPVRFDAGALEQVVFNLLDNAVKYSRDDRRIDVRVQPGQHRGQVLIAVTDHGIGIDPADTKRIFRAYQRGKGSANTAGLGLGLALCRDIVKAHRGRIEVTSRMGSGSTFAVILPAGGSHGSS